MQMGVEVDAESELGWRRWLQVRREPGKGVPGSVRTGWTWRPSLPLLGRLIGSTYIVGRKLCAR